MDSLSPSFVLLSYTYTCIQYTPYFPFAFADDKYLRIRIFFKFLTFMEITSTLVFDWLPHKHIKTSTKI